MKTTAIIPLFSLNGRDRGSAGNTRFENKRIIVSSGGEATCKFDKSKGKPSKGNLFPGNASFPAKPSGTITHTCSSSVYTDNHNWDTSMPESNIF